MCHWVNLKVVAALATIGISVCAFAGSTYSFSGAFIPAVQASGVSVAASTFLGTETADFVFGDSVVVNSGSILLFGSGPSGSTLGSEMGLELYNSLYPGLEARRNNFWSSSVNINSGVVTIPQTYFIFSGNLIGGEIYAGSTWRFNAYDTFPDNIGGNEGIVAMSITVGGTPIPRQTFTINGPSVDSMGDPDNTLITAPTYNGLPYRLGSVFYRGGTITGDPIAGNLGNWKSDATIIMRNSAVPGFGLRLIPFFNQNEGYSGTIAVPQGISQLAAVQPGLNSGAYISSLAGQIIPSGSVWTAELSEFFNETENVPEATWSNLVFDFLTEGAVAPNTGTPPTTLTDLGTIDSTIASFNSPLTVAQSPFSFPGEVRWYKFTIERAISPYLEYYLDLFGTPTENTPPSAPIHFGLFDSCGVLRATDHGSGPGGFSQMSFGGVSNARPAISTMPNALEGEVFFGWDNLAALPAGTYYLGATRSPSSFSHGFGISSTSNSFTADWNLNFRTNIPSLTITLSGNLELQNTGDDGVAGTESIEWTLSNIMQTFTGTVMVDDFGGGPYSFVIPAEANPGIYSLRMKGGTFLASTYSINYSGSNISYNVSLRNGDIDQDGEVGPGDFEAVVAQFGGPGAADLDNDGEVGPSDFEVVVANFGLGDE